MRKLAPHVDTHKSKGDRVYDLIAILLFVAVIIYTIFQWNQLPEQVPIHFNGAGEVDNYGSKWFLFLLPMISAGLFAFLEFLERHPETHNYPKRLSETNAPKFYQYSRKLLNRVKNLSLLLMVYIQWEVVRVALGYSTEMSNIFFGGFLALMFVVMFFGMYQMRKIK
ncbi:DUF1648 domain-containing protein [Sporosarcina gallistercoris]|uniref:DUF1648 domain-containing protein n=1 Tax=Sporosarcina gallistercoris TaxID=2762245 RepID=A0ABR8PMG3_9BACL|nr:DUF1648 domain-containing protein [Sporosarcina gallistercoris]MBD7909365.1 DUF1648 domain-containing protein [Sporosarcina gallistercoris]